MLRHMVNRESNLNRTFAALADPNRRAMLVRLERNPVMSVSALARPLKVKLPAVLKHLAVLDRAGLIARKKSGRIVTVRLRSPAMREASIWLARYERFSQPRLDRLAAYAEAQERATRVGRG